MNEIDRQVKAFQTISPYQKASAMNLRLPGLVYRLILFVLSRILIPTHSRYHLSLWVLIVKLVLVAQVAANMFNQSLSNNILFQLYLILSAMRCG